MDSPTVERQRNRFVAFSFAAADLLIEVESDGSITHALGASTNLFGLRTDEIVGARLLEFFAPSEHDFVQHLLCETEAGSRFGPLLIPLAPGFQPHSVVVSGCRLPDDPGRVYLALSEATFAMMPDQLAKQRDAMTGMLDRESFELMAKDTFATARGLKQDVRLTLIAFPDTVDFEQRLGEIAHEKFRAKMGNLLRAHALNNAAGVVNENRYAVLHDASLDGTAIAQQLSALAREADPEGKGFEVVASTLDLESRLADEDAGAAIAYTIARFATADASHSLPDTLDAASRQSIVDTADRVNQLRRIINERRIKLVGQPIVSFATGKPHHYELLVRFDGERSPFPIITFAEQMDFVQDLDLTVCNMALDLIVRTPPERPLKIAINLSGRSITSASFVARLLNLLINRALGRQLVFEITESSHIEDLQSVNNVINGLRKLGHLICLDDFGAGAASFPYLASLDVDFVKIDGRYVREAAASRRNALMLKSIASLCRDLGIKTVAEMVETREQAQLMESLGLDFAQGYYFGRPQPVTDLIAGSIRQPPKRSPKVG